MKKSWKSFLPCRSSSKIKKLSIELDLCLLEFYSSNEKLIAIKIATHEPEIGELVYAIGAHHGIFPAKLAGYVSSKIDSNLKYNVPEYDCRDCKLYSTTLPVTVGFSGSPVYNSNYELVGIILAVNKNYEHFAMVASLLAIKQFLQLWYANL